MRPYLALIQNDVRLAFRQRVVIFFNYLMPLVLFLRVRTVVSRG